MDELDYDALASALAKAMDAITPRVPGGQDASGTHVESLTEAVMGVTAGLCRIADAVNNLADAVREDEAPC